MVAVLQLSSGGGQTAGKKGAAGSGPVEKLLVIVSSRFCAPVANGSRDMNEWNFGHELVCVSGFAAEKLACCPTPVFLAKRRQHSSHDPIFAEKKKQALCHLLWEENASKMELKGYTTGSFQRGVPAWREALWVLVKCVFFQTPWPWPSTLRVLLLRAFGARVGEGVVIRSQVNVSFPWRLSVGDHVWFGEEVSVLSLAAVTIESHVCISQRAFLCTGSHDFRSAKFELMTKPITVRERSWIAAQAFIAPGVEIGPGSMVAAGSIVLENVPPKSLVRGNPAAVVKRFD